jgi:hypothetical protein
MVEKADPRSRTKGRISMCADELIAKGDACALKCEATEALKYYLPAEKLESANEHLLARISRNDARSFIKKGFNCAGNSLVD